MSTSKLQINLAIVPDLFEYPAVVAKRRFSNGVFKKIMDEHADRDICCR